MLVISGLVVFFYSDIKDIIAPDESAVFSFDLPPPPEVPDFAEPLLMQKIPKAEVSFEEDFDERAHLQLMRQNASQYNYTMAYRHGARIIAYLLASKELTAEWGHILLEAGKPEEAVPILQEAMSQDSANSKIAIDLAYAMLRSGDANGAIELLDHAIATGKDLNLTVAKAAVIGEHPDTTKRAAAELIFKSVLKSKQPPPDASYQYGRFLMQRGDFQNSRIHLENATKANPNEPRYIARLGMAEFYLKQDSKAEVLYKKALQMNPYDYNTWFNLGELYLSIANESTHSLEVRQKTHNAFRAYLKAVENDSLNAGAHYRIGLILNGNADYRGAIRHLDIALEKFSRSTPVMQQLSSAYIQLGDTAQAIDYLEKILEIDPFDRIAANEYIRIREQQK